MKSVIIFLIAISSFFVSLGQEKQDVVIPDSVAAKIIDELIVKDALEIKVNVQDSIIQVITIDLERKTQEIKILKTNEEEFRGVVSKLNEVIEIKTAQNKDLQKRLNRAKSKGLVAHILTGIGVIILIVVTPKH